MSELKTQLCSQLGIDYPILSVGFAASAGPELAAAVSEAGGLGVLGGSPPDAIRQRVAHMRKLTSRPFGQNVIIAALEGPRDEDGIEEARAEVRERIAVTIDERVAVLVVFWGDPTPFVAEAHARGVKLFVQTGSLEEARRAAQAGVDAVIVQGIEAGGHVRATESLWEVLPRVVREIAPLPVIASGGIGSGAGIARAIRAGAQGVSLGTRFVASIEAWTDQRYKQRIVESKGGDTVLTSLFDVWWPDAPHRVLRNKAVREWEHAGRPASGRRPHEGESIGTLKTPWGRAAEWPRYAVGMMPPEFDGDPEDAPLWAGESAGDVHEIKPAGEIVRDLVREAEAALETTPS